MLKQRTTQLKVIIVSMSFIPHLSRLLKTFSSGLDHNSSHVIPSMLTFFEDSSGEKQWSALMPAVQMYRTHITDPLCIVQCEYQLWRQKWEKVPSEKRPSTAVSALGDCSQYFTNICTLLQILATLPVSTFEAEWIFSKLERTLTAFRSTMTEQWLEALMLLQIHRSHCPDINSVTDKFAQTSARRLRFTL